ncbi:hypothetical protein [Brevibacillus dissolubilis]|uniref:hypothetical protein n=1 Tax=Brevibacillus dissolubilis TaxID=1844116 RepID=UPI001116A700|nr:hypothetical protein [Brevibacillus dissolubilis]
MKYHILQTVTIVDMNNEIIREAAFDHGQYEFPALPGDCAVLTHKLGLKGFDVVYDKREEQSVRYKIQETEIDLTNANQVIRVYLEPITLILGQHDVGEI